MNERALRWVLHVAGPARGGIRSHLRLLARHLPASGYRVWLAAPEAAELESEAWSPLPLTDCTVSALSPAVLLPLVRRLRSLRPTLLHAHGYKAAMAALLAGAAAPGTRRVVTFHNLWPARAGSAERFVLRALVRRAALIAVSEAVAESVRAAAPGAAVTVIGNGVELERFAAGDREAARAALGLAPDDPVIGYFGRLTREKGADLAITAMAMLRERGTPARLLVAGEGPERAALEAGAGSGALFLGEREDVPRLLAACDVVAIPSRAEGQSVVALEAFAAGRPVVAARVGGLAALAEAGGGLLAPPEDAGALASALGRLLADPGERAERGAVGRAYVARHASAAKTAAAVAALYDRQVAGSEKTGDPGKVAG